MGFPYGETVVVLAAGVTQDDYDNDVENWDNPATVATVTGVGVEPRPEGETYRSDRNAVVSGFTLYDSTNALAAVSPQHRITVRGSTWAVDGEPAEWRNPFTGWQPGTVVQVGRIDG